MCGCKKASPRPTTRTASQPRLQTVKSNNPAPNTAELLKLKVEALNAKNQPVLQAGMTADRRAIELKRRTAILARLGKL